MTQDIKVVALELANSLENVFFFPGGSDPIRAVVARVEELEAQLSSVGAGGVEPLRKCLHQIAEPVAAAPQAVQPIKANCYSDNDGDSWRDCPDDCDFVDGLELGDTFELQASVRAWSETFRVTKAPDDTSDDYEVELVSTNAPIAATNPTQQGLEQVEQRQLDIGKAVWRAFMDLPQGTELVVSLKKDAGTVTLFDSNENEFDHFGEYCETFAGRIHAAIDGAIVAEQVAAQAKQGA